MTQNTIPIGESTIVRAMGDRVIIGECPGAGMPISAPVREGYDSRMPNIRWMERHNTFVLEHWEAGQGGWYEVPLVKP